MFALVGCMLRCRPLGVIEAEQTGHDGKTIRNDRVVAVPIESHGNSHSDVKSQQEMNSELLKELEQFFINYNSIRPATSKFKLLGCRGPKTALRLVSKAITKKVSACMFGKKASRSLHRQFSRFQIGLPIAIFAPGRRRHFCCCGEHLALPLDSTFLDSCSRRTFIKQAGAGGLALTSAFAIPGCGETSKDAGKPVAHTAAPAEPVQLIDIELTVNTQKHALKIDTRTTLLDLLRENLALTGTKKGCDHGQCGACTVLVNGRTLNSCLALAALHSGSEIVTVEGLGTETELHPVQAAFIKHDAFQCGDCTPGQIMSAVALLNFRHKRRFCAMKFGSRIHERQHLPLRRLFEHRGRGTGSGQEKRAGEKSMKPFTLLSAAIRMTKRFWQ